MGVLCGLTGSYISDGDICYILPLVPRFHRLKGYSTYQTELTSTVTSGACKFYKLAGLPIICKYSDSRDDLEVKDSFVNKIYEKKYGAPIKDIVANMPYFVGVSESDLYNKVRADIVDVMYVSVDAYDFISCYIKESDDFIVGLIDRDKLSNDLLVAQGGNHLLLVSTDVDRANDIISDFEIDLARGYYNIPPTGTEWNEFIDCVCNLYLTTYFMAVCGKYCLPATYEDGANIHHINKLMQLSLAEIINKEVKSTLSF